MTVFNSNPCHNEVRYKGTVLYSLYFSHCTGEKNETLTKLARS